MKFFIPKSYQLTENKKWIPSATIIKESHITEEYSVREKEFNTREEANRFITEFCIKKGIQIANTEKRKEYCENLYDKYKELKEKTKLEVHDIKPGGRIDAKHINIRDMEEKIKVKEELHDCLNLLKNEQLKELFDDTDFMGDAVKILAERKRTNQF